MDPIIILFLNIFGFPGGGVSTYNVAPTESKADKSVAIAQKDGQFLLPGL